MEKELDEQINFLKNDMKAPMFSFSNQNIETILEPIDFYIKLHVFFLIFEMIIFATTKKLFIVRNKNGLEKNNIKFFVYRNWRIRIIFSFI